MVKVDEMINNLVDNAHGALSDLETFDQSQVDSIVDAMVQAGLDNSAELARLAHEENGRANTVTTTTSMMIRIILNKVANWTVV